MEQGPCRGESPAAAELLLCAGGYCDPITERHESDSFWLGAELLWMQAKHILRVVLAGSAPGTGHVVSGKDVLVALGSWHGLAQARPQL